MQVVGDGELAEIDQARFHLWHPSVAGRQGGERECGACNCEKGGGADVECHGHCEVAGEWGDGIRSTTPDGGGNFHLFVSSGMLRAGRIPLGSGGMGLLVQHLVIESSSTYGDESAESTLSVNSLGLEPASFEMLMVFLEELSRTGDFEDLKLVFEGESNNNQYVTFTVPAETEEPILQEEQLVVWEMEDIENLEEVTYEVETNQTQTTTIITTSVIALGVLGAAVYVIKTKI